MALNLRLLRVLVNSFVLFPNTSPGTTNGQRLVKCPLFSTIFYQSACVACIERQRSAEQNLTLDHLRVNQNDTDFVVCQEQHSAITKYLVRWGASALRGRRLNVVTIQRPPFSEILKNQDEIESFAGVVFEFLSSMNHKYNFSMNILTPPDGNWGMRIKNGTWNGMIGMVLRNEAELGASCFSITEERLRAVQFTTPFHLEPAAILIPAPTEEELLTALIKPLGPEVWLALGLTIVAVVLTLYFINGMCWKPTSYRTLSRIGLYITGTLVQQAIQPPVRKTRLLLGIWWVATIVIANTYLAFVVSFLSAPKLHNAVNSLDELANQRRLQWTFRQDTAIYELFKSENSTGTFKVIGSGVKDGNLVESDHEGVNKVRTGKWVFIKEKSFLDVALNLDFETQKECRLTIAKHTFFTVGLGLIVPKSCTYLPLLDYEISNAISTGLMAKWKSIHWPKHLQCVNAETYTISMQPPSHQLTLVNVEGAIFILNTGLILAVGVIFLEIILQRANLVRNGTQTRGIPWVFLK